MKRREFLTGAASLAGIAQAQAFGIGKLGAGEGHLGVLGTANAYLGQIATRSWIPNNFFATNKQIMSRTFHYARDVISSLQIVIPNFTVVSAAAPNMGENGPGATATVTASIEYPAGTFHQATFSGSTSGTIADGGMIVTDPIAVSIPNGAQFFCRIWYSCAAGIIYGTSSNGMSTGDGVAFGVTTPDLTMSGTVTQATNITGVAPAALIAMTKKRSVALLGNSRGYGASDTGDSSGDLGEMARSIGPSLAYLNLCVPSDRAIDFTTGSHSTNRRALMSYASSRVSEFGINDVTQGAAPSAIVSALQTIAGYKTTPIWQTTISPQTTSTDSWATTANQTPNANNSNRVSLNGSIRAGLAGFAGFFEIADVNESARDSGKWVVNGVANYATPDGIHENRAQNLRIAASGAINPAVFG